MQSFAEKSNKEIELGRVADPFNHPFANSVNFSDPYTN
jgi:hypothetical protein